MELLALSIIFVVFVLFVLNTFSVRRQELRNDERRSDVAELDYALRVFKEKEGYYPSLRDYSSVTWREENLPTVAPEFFQAPKGIIGSDVAYKYAPRLDDKECLNSGEKCQKFTLTAILEADAQDVVIFGQ